MERWEKTRHSLKWLPTYLWQRLRRPASPARPVHLIFTLADHFEPAIVPDDPETRASHTEQERRLQRWCREYCKMADRWRDDDGFPFQHTYFYPAEQYDEALIERLVEHCQAGWGEIETQLHHGLQAPDTSENTRLLLLKFRDALAARGCLSREDETIGPRYAFVHGNWALANSANGQCCGVDNELQILAETGCYADFTMPSAPSPAQVAKINALYECALPLNHRAPHRRGRDLQCGHSPEVFPLIIQGPLMIDFRRAWPPLRIENAALTTANPPCMSRLRLWRRAAITVRGRPDWVFIKLHCHGMDPRDEEAMLGAPMRQFLQELTEGSKRSGDYRIHFATAREMVNIILAACDGREGNPGHYRNYRFRLITPRRKP